MSAAGGLDRFLTAVEKLPPYEGLTFRGLASGHPAPSGTGMVTGVMASSRNPRVASENFSAAALLALLTRTGRDISALSAHPDEAEVVVLPGSLWRPIVTVEAEGVAVHVLEELDVQRTGSSPAAWGASQQEVLDQISRALQVARVRPPAQVSAPGKFAGPWLVQLPSAGSETPRSS